MTSDIGHWTRGDTEVRRHSPAHNAGSEHRPQVQDEVSTCGLVEALSKPFDLPSTIRFSFFRSLYLPTHDSTVHRESYVDAFLHLNHFSV